MELTLLFLILGLLICFVISFVIFIVDYAEFKSKVQDIIDLDAKINNTSEEVLLHAKDIINDNQKIMNLAGRIVSFNDRIVNFNDKLVRHFAIKSDEENNDE
jgi:hypothetical protein